MKAVRRRKRRKTFKDILEATKLEAASNAWNRAVEASKLRHIAANQGERRSARKLAEIKVEAIRTAIGLLPEQITTSLDDDYQIGLLSIRWRGHGWLHLPAATNLVIDEQVVPGMALGHGIGAFEER